MAVKPATKKSPAPTAEKKTRSVDAHGRRVRREGEPELARYAEVEPTALQNSFADWLTTQTGYKVDAQSVALATALRGNFQKSPENQADLEARRVAAAEAKAAKAERAEARAKSASEAKPVKAKKAAKAVEVEEEEEEEVEAPTPAKRTTRKPAVKAAAAVAASEAKPKRRRPAAKAAALDDEI